jgi:hypothetical protein
MRVTCLMAEDDRVRPTPNNSAIFSNPILPIFRSKYSECSVLRPLLGLKASPAQQFVSQQLYDFFASR